MQSREKALRILFAGASFISAAATLSVLGFMLILGLPLLRSGMFPEILIDPWSPDHGQYGIYAMMAGTFYIAGLSLCLGFPVSLGCAVFIRITPGGRWGVMLKRIVRFMTAVPTVIYGFVGVFLLVPAVRTLSSHGSGMCVLSAAVMLGLLIAPTMILFFSQSFERVPNAFTDAVDALGGTLFQKFFYVILPQAWPGILTGLILAFGRAMGDTLIALMISGNSVAMPASILDSARTLTAHIALIIAADFDGIEFKTLFVCGAVLYLMTCMGILAARITGRQWER